MLYVLYIHVKLCVRVILGAEYYYHIKSCMS